MNAELKTVHSQPSWVLSSDQVELAVTKAGGHMAPVTFFPDKDPIRPYYVSPWQDEGLTLDTEVLRPLRGDFFCMPFGANAPYRGESHPVHGEPATADWTLVGAEQRADLSFLELRMHTKTRPGTVNKRIAVPAGQSAVYVTHRLEGYSGAMSLGHHATLDPLGESDTMLLSTSPILFGLVAPRSELAVQGGEYSSLSPGAAFRRLDRVPTIWKTAPFADCSVFPRRRGFGDILQMYNRPTSTPAWSAAVYPRHGFLWFALKDAELLNSTLLWMDNHGRHQVPWNGRNLCIGIEDLRSAFASGIQVSAAKNPASERGVSTSIRLKPDRPLTVNYLEGVVRVPKGFDRVVRVSFSETETTFHSASGKSARARVRSAFVFDGRLSEDEVKVPG